MISVPLGRKEPLSYLCAGHKRLFRHIDPVMKRMAALLRRDVLQIRQELGLLTQPYRWLVIRGALNNEPVRLASHPRFQEVVRTVSAIRADWTEAAVVAVPALGNSGGGGPVRASANKYSAPDLSSTVNYVCHRLGIAEAVMADRDFPRVTSPASRRRFEERVRLREAHALRPLGGKGASSAWVEKRCADVEARSHRPLYRAPSVVRVRRCQLLPD